MTIKLKAKIAGAFLHSFQMQLKPRYSVRWFKTHCLDQVKAETRIAESRFYILL
jgi:hypothetical protein